MDVRDEIRVEVDEKVVFDSFIRMFAFDGAPKDPTAVKALKAVQAALG